jgi:RNA polymerase sigma factor (sigma-70 family)
LKDSPIFLRINTVTTTSITPAGIPARHELFSFLSPDLKDICHVAHRRLQSWQPPPNQSARNWSEERAQLAEVAAHAAVTALQTTEKPRPGQFIYDYIIASVRTQYRREWSYSLHFTVCDMRTSLDEDETIEPLQEDRNPAYAELHDALQELDAAQRFVLEQLFFLGKTESELAGSLHISQRAVSKRKQVALKALATNLRPGPAARGSPSTK